MKYQKIILLILFLVLACCQSMKAQVPVVPLAPYRQQFDSATGIPLAGGCLFFDAAGTSTPQAIYSDSSGSFQLNNPLQLDAAGSASVWLTNTSYRIILTTGVPAQPCSTFPGTQLWVQDNIPGFGASGLPQIIT